MLPSPNQRTRDEIVAALNSTDPSDFPPIEIDHRGDVFHSALGDFGSVILSSEQLGAVAALVDAARRSNDPETLLAKIARLRQLCETPFDVLEIESDDGTITNTAVIRAVDVQAILDPAAADHTSQGPKP
ncbi:hypothetical protein [Mycobacteroides abscessus]|uniref:hypothetical protein n=1 Tax=Mycobacteroides abscessus TaxID=36809 RepID=UPI0013000751|nr:hypothetical protein [Mycobacteroides abscessus]